ncbi:hypothetical protein IWW48_005979 [Coemansia sp. RSA 1200]|nr:hypothetical protein IWW48_005979 [Coemansia sp. RSA 1200]
MAFGNSNIPSNSPEGGHRKHSHEHSGGYPSGIKGNIEKTVDKVKDAIGGNKKEEHDYAHQAGATAPVPMSEDPRVSPLGSNNNNKQYQHYGAGAHNDFNATSTPGDRKEHHGYAQYPGATAPAPMGLDSHVEPFHDTGLPATNKRNDYGAGGLQGSPYNTNNHHHQQPPL